MALVKNDHIIWLAEQVLKLWVLCCLVRVILVASAFVVGPGLILCTVRAPVHSLDSHHLFIDDQGARAGRIMELADGWLSHQGVGVRNECIFRDQLLDFASPDATHCSARAGD